MRKFALFTTMCLSLAGIGQAATIFSENFNTVATGGNLTGTVGGFTVTSGNVDVVGTNPSNFFSTLCVGGETVNCVDLDGNTAGTLSTNLGLLATGNYTLSFNLNGSQVGGTTSTTVTLGSLFTNTYTLSTTSVNTFTVPIVVSSAQTATLSFASNTPGFSGALLDNVVLTLDSPLGTVPEPSSVVLMLGALVAGLLASQYRKNRTEARSQVVTSL